MPRNPGYWNELRILRNARRFETISQWQRVSSGAYEASRRIGVFEKAIRHMREIKKPKGTWNIKSVLREAKKYKNVKDWKEKSHGSYLTSFKLGIHTRACKHMRFLRNPKYSYSEIRLIARRYSTRKSFRKGSQGVYSAAAKKGILQKICDHMKPTMFKGNLDVTRSIYALIFSNRHVYIGLSINPKSRFQGHIKAPKGAVREYLKKYGQDTNSENNCTKSNSQTSSEEGVSGSSKIPQK